MKRFTKQFALCLDNEGNEASLIIGKVYPASGRRGLCADVRRHKSS